MAVISLLLLSAAVVLAQRDWSTVEKVLTDGIADQAFPGCVALVADKTGTVWAKGFGHFTYGIPPPFSGGQVPAMTLDTRFDMASCTKVLMTTTAVGLIYQRGFIHLDQPVAHPDLLGPDFAQQGKGVITIRHLMLHNAGLPPDPSPNYWAKSFGCPESSKPKPELSFSCRQKIWDSLMKQTMARPVNTQYVYSDLSMITMANVVGRVAQREKLITDAEVLPNCLIDPLNPSAPPTKAAIYQCYFEAFIRKFVIAPLGLRQSGYLPPRSVWGGCAPAENDTDYTGKCIQGEVSDGNTYAMGGIAGHAGLFTTAPEAHTIMHAWLYGIPGFLNSTTTSLFIKQYNHTQSSRALGWNTNDPDVTDQGWSLSCGTLLSPKTFMHTGYTGTEVCGDPIFPGGGLITILLTNRVYPTDKTGSTKIHAVRVKFGDAVAKVMSPGIKPDWWKGLQESES